MRFLKVPLVTALVFSIPHNAMAQYEHRVDDPSMNSQPEDNTVYETMDPLYIPLPAPDFGSSGTVEHVMEPEYSEQPSPHNPWMLPNNSSNETSQCPNSGKSRSPQYPNGLSPTSVGQQGNYGFTESDIEKARVIKQLMIRYGIAEVKADVVEPEWKKLSSCEGGFQKKQCSALLARSLSDQSQADYELNAKYKNIDVSKSWDDFKKAIELNPGITKEIAISESLNPSTHVPVTNFVIASDASSTARLQASVEAVGLIDQAVAEGRGSEAKQILDRLALLNPSAANAVTCLLSQNSLEDRSPAYGKDVVGPISGTVYARFKDSETGFAPVIIWGGIAASDALIAAGAATAVTAAVAGGLILLAEGVDKTRGYWHDITTGKHGPAEPPPEKKPPVDYKTIALNLVGGGVVGYGVWHATEGRKSTEIDTKDGSKSGPKEGSGSASNDQPAPKEKETSGNPNPGKKVIKEGPEEIKETNVNPGPVKEWLPAEDLAERLAAEALRKAEELLQEFSIHHFVDSDPAAAQELCEEMTQEEKQELITTYTDAVYEARVVAQMPIDFKSSDWNKMPDELANQCAVVDPIDPQF